MQNLLIYLDVSQFLKEHQLVELMESPLYAQTAASMTGSLAPTQTTVNLIPLAGELSKHNH